MWPVAVAGVRFSDARWLMRPRDASPCVAAVPARRVRDDRGSTRQVLATASSRELTSRKLRRLADRSVAEFSANDDDWIEGWNENPDPHLWLKTIVAILDSLASDCNPIQRLRK